MRILEDQPSEPIKMEKADMVDLIVELPFEEQIKTSGSADEPDRKRVNFVLASQARLESEAKLNNLSPIKLEPIKSELIKSEIVTKHIVTA